MTVMSTPNKRDEKLNKRDEGPTLQITFGLHLGSRSGPEVTKISWHLISAMEKPNEHDGCT